MVNSSDLQLGIGCMNTEMGEVKSVYLPHLSVTGNARDLHDRLSRTPFSDQGKEIGWAYRMCVGDVGCAAE